MRNFRRPQLSFISEAQLLKCSVLRIVRERQNSSWQILRCLVCFHFALISGMLRGMFSCKPHFNKKMTMVKSSPVGYLKNKNMYVLENLGLLSPILPDSQRGPFWKVLQQFCPFWLGWQFLAFSITVCQFFHWRSLLGTQTSGVFLTSLRLADGMQSNGMQNTHSAPCLCLKVWCEIPSFVGLVFPTWSHKAVFRSRKSLDKKQKLRSSAFWNVRSFTQGGKRFLACKLEQVSVVPFHSGKSQHC